MPSFSWCSAYFIKSYHDETTGLKEHTNQEHLLRLEYQAENIAEFYSHIYSGLRTISYLPYIRKIEPGLKNFTEDADLTIQQIYNIIAQSVNYLRNLLCCRWV